MNKQGHIVPMRPCSLCDYFILTGNDPRSADAYARCDAPGFEREIFPGQDVKRCSCFIRGFVNPHAKAPTLRSGFGIGALITTDAKSHYETNCG